MLAHAVRVRHRSSIDYYVHTTPPLIRAAGWNKLIIHRVDGPPQKSRSPNMGSILSSSVYTFARALGRQCVLVRSFLMMKAHFTTVAIVVYPSLFFCSIWLCSVAFSSVRYHFCIAAFGQIIDPPREKEKNAHTPPCTTGLKRHSSWRLHHTDRRRYGSMLVFGFLLLFNFTAIVRELNIDVCRSCLIGLFRT